ncbi:hypothetical protein AWB69_09148 [Caballeronia udeis]|uniref:Uncharacterized protein n=1 Tax=Caballeronia udeis TaxID=1232866 RepID=A0A158JZ53_9BURK|nr:hypothetical protein [Caballeronia udeis]SAL74182.1 hypothetical protein AWB69_09148 [Caballeronia udeis]
MKHSLHFHCIGSVTCSPWGNLAHASISMTSQYLDADDDDRHRARKPGLRLDW